jgi:multicomponent Na+:H+ antiporter subunit E
MAKFVTFVIMLAFWVLLSGMFDGFHLTLGIISCLLVSFFSHDLLFYGKPDKAWIKRLLGLLLYSPWLFYQICLASMEIAYIVLHPRMLEIMDPRLIRFRTRLKTNLSRFTFAQSITLTPGTITVNMMENEFTVYALTKNAADKLPGEMEARVAKALEGEK